MVCLDCPAKLNLFLHVTGTRPDGYHTLDSVFIPVDLVDTLTIEPSDVARRQGNLTGPVEDDLCVRAQKALERATGRTLPATLSLTKRIPVGAGMGGGSSDAAGTLVGLNRAFELGLSDTDLAAIALTIGADVPFFINPRPAWVSGIGEVLTPIDFPKVAFDVVFPGAFVSTRSVFSHRALVPSGHVASIDAFEAAVADGSWPRFGQNDLEPVAKLLNSAVRDMLERFPELRLTGSGSAAFVPNFCETSGLRYSELPQGWRHFSLKTFKI